MKIKKRIHKVYKEFVEAKKKGSNLPQLMGKYQYIFSNSNGKISLIEEIRHYVGRGIFWEIYCLKGNLFEDCERFITKDKAIKKIKEYLEVDELTELIEKKLENLKCKTAKFVQKKNMN